MFDALDMGASGLTAQRTRMDVIAQNIANADTTHDADGRRIPYRRKFATLMVDRDENGKPGVRVGDIQSDMSPFVPKYDPYNKDADVNGYVQYPNVDLAVEFTNAIEASRAYEANVNMMEVTKAMLNASLRLLA